MKVRKRVLSFIAISTSALIVCCNVLMHQDKLQSKYERKVKIRRTVFLLITTLSGILIVVDFIVCRCSDIEIIRMEELSDGYNFGRPGIKRDFFCVYNHRWRTKAELSDSIKAFDARTVSKDTIQKYSEWFIRYFYVEGHGLTKDFYDPRDLEKIMEYSNRLYFVIERQDYYTYGVPYMRMYIDGLLYRVKLEEPIEWFKILDTRLLTEEDRLQ